MLFVVEAGGDPGMAQPSDGEHGVTNFSHPPRMPADLTVGVCPDRWTRVQQGRFVYLPITTWHSPLQTTLQMNYRLAFVEVAILTERRGEWASSLRGRTERRWSHMTGIIPPNTMR